MLFQYISHRDQLNSQLFYNLTYKSLEYKYIESSRRDMYMHV